MDRSKKKMLVIGYEEFNDCMYPHVYDVLNLLSERFQLYYFNSGNRGSIFFDGNAGLVSSLRAKYIRNRRLFEIRGKLIEYAKEESFDFVLPIDHFALHILFMTDIRPRERLIFWSLDFISLDHPWYLNNMGIRKFNERSKFLLSKCDAVVIQDENRGVCFDSIYMTHSIKKIYLPVSILKSHKRSATLVTGRQIKLGQLGSIHDYRGSEELLRNYQYCEQNVQLILRGFVADRIVSLNNSLKRRANVISDIASIGNMRNFLTEIDVGYSDLKHNDLNSSFVSMASGQTVEFLHLGIPLIVAGNYEQKKFFSDKFIGVCIDREDKNSLDAAIDDITKNYFLYSNNATSLFEQYFNLTLYKDSLLKQLDD